MALSKKTDPYSEMREGVEEGVRARNLSVQVRKVDAVEVSMISVVLFLKGTRLRVWVADAGREVRGKQNRLKMSLRRRGKVLRGDQLYEVQMTGASAVVIQRLNYFIVSFSVNVIPLW